jgi:rRNA maturation RNase YbeY
MILIKNTQRTIKIDMPWVQKDIETILNIIGYKDFDLGVWITTNKTIRRYNRLYRSKNNATDILSFSFHPDIKPGEKIVARSDENKNLGDLIISAEYVYNYAQQHGISFQDRLRILIIHGICHLLGYDHIEDNDYAVMDRKEKDILKKLINRDNAAL